jgi:hypothetical protein
MKSLSVVKKPSATAAKRFAAALAVVLGGFASQQAVACSAGEFNPVGGFVSAPIVLVGEITDSEAIVGTKSTRITLLVSERLIGEAPREITLIWPGHPDGLTAPQWSGDPHVMIAAEPPRTGGSRRDFLGFEDVDPSLPAIIGGHCTPYRIISANDQWADEIRHNITRRWRFALVWKVALLLAVAVPAILAFEYLAKASSDRRKLVKAPTRQQSYAQRQQRHAALGGYQKHLPPL